MKLKRLMIISLLLISLLLIPISFASDVSSLETDHASDMAIGDNDNDLNLESDGGSILKDSKNALQSIEDDRLVGNYSGDDADSHSPSVHSSPEIETITNELNNQNSNIQGLDYSEYSDYVNLNTRLVDYDFNISDSNTIFVNASYTGSTQNGNQASPYNNIMSALSAFGLSSNTRGNIFIADGLYTINRRTIISKNLNLIGQSSSNTIINGNGYQFLMITPAYGAAASPLINIFNLTITKASSYYGGAVYVNESAVNFVNTIFRENSANEYSSYSTYPGSGGAIYNDKGFIRIYNSLFVNNTASGKYDSYAGAIFNDMGEMTILNSQFINNTVIGNYSSGGAIYDYSGILVLFNSNITGNTLISNFSIGGGLCNWQSHNVFIINSSIDSNKIYGKYTFGSAIANKAIMLDVVNSTISNNFANGTSDVNGTFINLNGIVNFTNVNFTNNRISKPKDDILICLEDQMIVSDAFDRELLVDLPSSYDLRDYGLVTPIKDQGGSGSCWAFTTIAAIESYLLKYENLTYDLSENNMKNLMGYYGLNGTDWPDGGNHYMSLAYLLRWSGPVNESQDPFDDASTSSRTFSNITKKVQDVLYIPVRLNYLDLNQIKYALMKYGALYTTMHADDFFQYNPDYYLDIISVSNHAVTLIGWDDNYSADKFDIKPPGDGAFIIKNSWGDDYGYDGYWYISYYDKAFAGFGLDTISAMAITNVENVSAYKNIYQYDILGNTFESLGYNCNTAWFANQFKATNNNPLAAFGLYTYGSSSYLVNITVNGISKLIQEGNISGAGYHTIKLDNYVDLIKGDNFKIIVKLTTPDSYYPVAIESQRSDYSSGASSNPDESFISRDGVTWHDLYDYKDSIKFYQFLDYYDMKEANVCLKAYTIGSSDVFLNVKSNVSTYTKGDLVELTVSISNDGDPVTGLNLSISLDSSVSIKSFTNLKGSFDMTNKIWHLGTLATGETQSLKLTLNMRENKEIVALSFDFNFSGYMPTNASTSKVLYLYYDGVTKFIDVENVSTSVKSNDSVGIQLVNLDNQPIENKEIVISLVESDNGYAFENITLVTDENGNANFILDLLEGNYVFLASFDGDSLYKASNMTFNVSVSKINTSISLNGGSDSITTLAKSNDTISFNLSDELLNGMPLKEIIISLLNGNEENNSFDNVFENLTLITDENGLANFNLDLTEGNYEFLVSFIGDEVYKDSSLTFNVNVLKRDTLIDLDSSSLILSNETDLISLSRSEDIIKFNVYDELNNPLRNQNITLTVKDLNDDESDLRTYDLITDSNGTASFVLDLTKSNYEFAVTFIGDNVYDKEEIKFNISVIKRNSPHIIPDDNIINDSDVYKAHFLDDEFNPIFNQSVTFIISNGNDTLNYSTITNENGIAILSGLSELDSGNYTVSIALDSNDLYDENTLLTDITILEREDDKKINTMFSILLPNGVKANVDGLIQFKLLDESLSPLGNRNITLRIINLNQSFDLITDSEGMAAYTINLNEGNYEFELAYLGDDNYSGSNSMFNISVLKENPILVSSNPVINNSDEFDVYLYDSASNPLANQTVVFSLSDASGKSSILNYTAVTDGDGKATLPGLSKLDEGNYTVNAKFDSNDLYNEVNMTKVIRILGSSIDNDTNESNQTQARKGVIIKYEDMVTESVLTAIEGRVGEYFNVTLVDENNNPLAGKLVKIGFNGKIYNKTTNATGGVRLQINLKTPVTYTFAICFLGDDEYNASFEVAKITVNKKKTSLTVPNKSFKASAKTKTLTATLRDGKGNLVANKKISFTVNGKTYSANTNSKGVASVKVSLSSKKTYSFSVKFAGDTCYGAVTKSAKVTIK